MAEIDGRLAFISVVAGGPILGGLVIWVNEQLSHRLTGRAASPAEVAALRDHSPAREWAFVQAAAADWRTLRPRVPITIAMILRWQDEAAAKAREAVPPTVAEQAANRAPRLGLLNDPGTPDPQLNGSIVQCGQIPAKICQQTVGARLGMGGFAQALKSEDTAGEKTIVASMMVAGLLVVTANALDKPLAPPELTTALLILVAFTAPLIKWTRYWSGALGLERGLARSTCVTVPGNAGPSDTTEPSEHSAQLVSATLTEWRTLERSPPSPEMINTEVALQFGAESFQHEWAHCEHCSGLWHSKLVPVRRTSNFKANQFMLIDRETASLVIDSAYPPASEDKAVVRDNVILKCILAAYHDVDLNDRHLTKSKFENKVADLLKAKGVELFPARPRRATSEGGSLFPTTIRDMINGTNERSQRLLVEALMELMQQSCAKTQQDCARLKLPTEGYLVR